MPTEFKFLKDLHGSCIITLRIYSYFMKYERERRLGIAKKLMNLLAIPSILSRSYSTFPLCSGTTLIEIAVYQG
jgi:hypothetical protein